MNAGQQHLPLLLRPQWPWALCMLSWALIHCFLDHPYRALLWDETMMTTPLRLLGMTWQDWAANPHTSAGIDTFAWYLGLGWALCATLVCCPIGRRTTLVVFSCSLALAALLTWARWAGHGYDAIWPLEFTLRLALPCAWLAYGQTATQPAKPYWRTIFLAACSATFIGHGCYALGLWPTPLAFQRMLGFWWEFSPSAQTSLLHLIGLLDILIAITVWIPKIRRTALIWMAIWGGATSLMRLYSIDCSFLGDSLLPAMTAAGERLGHCSMPLLCWWLYRQQNNTNQTTPETDL